MQPRENHRASRFDQPLRIAWWVLFAAAVSVTLLVRIRLLEMPLERDEGEYAYAGQLWLAGVPPYEAAYNMKFPGTYAANAAIMAVFGQTITALHLGLILVNLTTIAFIFLLGRRLLNVSAGLAAAASYSILSVSPAVLGFAGHATHFVVLPVLAGVLVLTRSAPLRNAGIFAAGILFGAGVLMKQPGIFFVPFGAAYLCWRDWRDRLSWPTLLTRTATFAAGVVAPFAATCLLLWWAGVFEKFWFWTVVYAREYGGLISFGKGIETFQSSIKHVVAPGWTLWSLAGLGVVAVLWKPKLRPGGLILLGLLICSAAAVTPGFYFRRHYFILALPAICLLAGGVAAWTQSLRFPALRFGVWLLFAGAFASALYAERTFYLERDPVAACRLAYGPNPFPEAIRIAEFLKERTGPNDKIAVMGSEPEIFFYAQRRAATGYLYIYSLMEPHRLASQMQREMISEIEAARPKYMVVVAVYASWLGHAGSEKLIFEWMNDYVAKNFRVVGLADMVSAEQTNYFLPATANAKATSQYSVVIYERM